MSTLDRDSSLTVRQRQDANTQLDLYATYKLDRQLTARLAEQCHGQTTYSGGNDAAAL